MLGQYHPSRYPKSVHKRDVMGERKIDSGNERLKEIESRIVETRL